MSPYKGLRFPGLTPQKAVSQDELRLVAESCCQFRIIVADCKRHRGRFDEESRSSSSP
jgi:hypothetical protein